MANIWDSLRNFITSPVTVRHDDGDDNADDDDDDDEVFPAKCWPCVTLLEAPVSQSVFKLGFQQVLCSLIMQSWICIYIYFFALLNTNIDFCQKGVRSARLLFLSERVLLIAHTSGLIPLDGSHFFSFNLLVSVYFFYLSVFFCQM